ncbi:MAG: thioesterase family protein [Pseudomonadota bacterium]
MRNDPARHDPATYPFTLDIHPRYGDMDTNAHLNNVAFARYFEEGRVRLHQHLRDRHPALDGPRAIIANVTIDYLAEGGWPDTCRLGAGVAHVGNSSYRIGMALFQAYACIALCDSTVVHRAADGPGGAPLPASLRAALEGLRLAASAI